MSNATDGSAITAQDLTEHDLEALRLYANGYSTVDIALRTNVKFDVARDRLNRVRQYFISRGLNVEAKRDLIRCATEVGLLNTGSITLPGAKK